MQMSRIRAISSRTWDIVGPALAGYLVAHFLAFFGPLLSAFAVRGLLQPLVAAWALSKFDRDGFHLATSLSGMLMTLLLAPVVGLISAACSRPLGMWRILLPAIAFVFIGLVGFRTVAMLSHRPYADEGARLAVSSVNAGFTLQAVVSLVAALPAALGAWLGAKLWPSRGHTAPDGSAQREVIAERVWFDDDLLHVLLTDGRVVAVPVEWFPRLRDATGEQRHNWRLIGRGVGIHWEDVDEDISVAGLLRP